MKSLNTYVIEGLADWGDDDKLDKKISKQTTKAAIKQEIIGWLKNNTITDVVKSRLKFDFNTSPITLDYSERIRFRENIDSLTNGLFQWGNVNAFDCSGTNITTLEGSPKKVKLAFDCIECKNLISLEGIPEEVGGFNCSYCPLLTSLEGLPKKIEGWFNCSRCISLKSLKGAPKEVGKGFDCKCCAITSLEGTPEKVGWNFSCSYCPSLKSLKGAPKEVGNIFSCSNCGSQFTEDDVKKVSNVKGEIFC